MILDLRLDLAKVNQYLEEQSLVLKKKFSETKEFTELFQYLPEVNPAKILKENTGLKQVIAKKHFCETGFLRSFDIEFSIPENIDDKIILLAEDEIDAGKLIQENKNPYTIFGIMKHSAKISSNLKNLQIYHILQEKEKISELNFILEKQIQILFSEIDWYYKGEKIEFEDEKEFNSFLSSIFDEKYRHGLSIQSEFLSSNKTSATATRAIRTLVSSLINNTEIKENSTEYGIYKELLAENDDKSGLIRHEMDEFLQSSEENRINLSEIYDKLKKEPYGLSNSIISVYLLAFILEHKTEVSLYEKGVFQLNLTPILYDRVINNPSNFEIQRNVFEGSRKAYFERFSELILNKKDATLLELVKPLISSVNSLDKHTKTTSNMSKDAVRVRDAVLNARDPYSLVFRDIPVALGFKNTTENLDELFDRLSNSFKEIRNRYSLLLKDIEDTIYSSFNIKKDKEPDKSREALRNKVEIVKSLISDNELKIFANNLQEGSLPYDKWLERIATFVNKVRIPKDWDDNDVSAFKVKVIQSAKILKNLEPIALDLNGMNFEENQLPVRLSITVLNELDRERVFFIRKDELGKMDNPIKSLIGKISKLTENQRLLLLTNLHRSFENA